MIGDPKASLDLPMGEPASRMAAGRDPVSRGVQRFVRSTAIEDGETAAWMRLRHRLRPMRRSRQRLVHWAMGAIAMGAAAVVMLVLWRPHFHDGDERIAIPTPPSTSGMASRSLRNPPVAQVRAPASPNARRWRPGAKPKALPAGDLQLAHARLQVDEHVRATARQVAGGELVRVKRGRIEVDVAPGSSGRIEVWSGGYSFVDVGTRFSVEKRRSTTILRVSEGVVEVRWGDRRLATISGPRGLWITPSRRSVTVSTATASPLGVAATASTCASLLASGDSGAALRCLEQKSSGHGVGAEAALYEVGRLRRDRFGDLTGALRAFEETRQRFPSGALRVEVQLSIVDLLPRLGRYREALDESASLIADVPGAERADELRLLRGNVYREGLGDCGRALGEYRALGEARGPTADDGAFFTAVCLEQLGRRSDAVAAYEKYLARPEVLRRGQAEKRLQALRP